MVARYGPDYGQILQSGIQAYRDVRGIERQEQADERRRQFDIAQKEDVRRFELGS
jgi:hypothetical protein